MKKQLTERDIERGYWLENAGVFGDSKTAESFLKECDILEMRSEKNELGFDSGFEVSFYGGSNFLKKDKRLLDKIARVEVHVAANSMRVKSKRNGEEFVITMPGYSWEQYFLFKVCYIGQNEAPRLDITDEQKARLLDIYGAAYDFELDVDGRAMELVESTLEALGVDTKFLEELDTERELED